MLAHCRSRALADRSLAPLAAARRCITLSARAARPQQQLAPGEVHVWWLHSDSVPDDQLAAGFLRLPQHEQQQVLESPSVAVQRQRTLARWFLRATLARYLPATPPEQLHFKRNDYGKPFLSPESAAGNGETQGIAAQLQFNLSHTASLLGCAVCLDRQVGLDVELMQRHQVAHTTSSSSSRSRSRSSSSSSSSSDEDSDSSSSSSSSRRDILKLARRRFSAEEVQELEAASDPLAREQLFMALWTLKESVVKARGTGINAPPGLRGFSIGGISPGVLQQPFQQQQQQQVAGISLSHRFPEQEQQQYDLLLCRPSSQHFAAVCVQQPLQPAAGSAGNTTTGSMRLWSNNDISSSSSTGNQHLQVLAASSGWDLPVSSSLPVVVTPGRA